MENGDHHTDQKNETREMQSNVQYPWTNNHPDKLLNGTKYHTNKFLLFNLKSIDVTREAKNRIEK